MPVKLHRCPNMWAKFGGHPCWKVQKALDDQGIEYEVVKGSWPGRSKRTEVVRAGTGQSGVSGDRVRGRQLVSRAVEGHGADDPRRPSDGEARGRQRVGLSPVAMITIEEGSERLQQLIAGWRYPEPYDFYDGDTEPVLNPERFFEARDGTATRSVSTTSKRGRPTSTTASACGPT